MNQRRTQSHKIVKNRKVARIIAASASRMHGKRYKAVETQDGWIIGRRGGK